MRVSIRFDPSFAAGHPPVEVSGSDLTAREALTELARSAPSVGVQLLNCDGQLRSVFRILLGDREVPLDEHLRDGDVLVVALR